MGIPDWLHTKVYQIFGKLLTLQRGVNTVGTKKILELNPSIETGSPFYYDQGPLESVDRVDLKLQKCISYDELVRKLYIKKAYGS